MESRGNLIEVLGNIMGPIDSVGDHTYVNATWRKRPMDTPDLIHDIVWMDVFHDLVAVRNVHCTGLGWHIHAVKDSQVEVGREIPAARNLVRYIHGDYLFHLLGYLH